jgi:hypothetical protein
MLDERNAKLLQDHWENERVGNSDAFNKAKNKGYISLKSSKGSIVPSIVLLNTDGTLKKDDMGRLAIASRPSLVSTLNSKPVNTPTQTIEQKKQNSQTAPASFFASHIPGKHEHDYEDMQNNVALNLPLNTPRKQGLLLEDHAKGQKAYDEGLDPYTAMVHTVLHESDQEKRRQMLSAMNRKFEKQLDKNIKPGITVRDFLVMLTDRKRNELAKKFKDHVIAYKAKHSGKSTETPDKVRMGPVWDKIKKAASSIWGKIKGWDEKVSNPAGVPDNDEKPRPTSPTAKAPIKRDTSTYSSLHPLEAPEHHDILAPVLESLVKAKGFSRGKSHFNYSDIAPHIQPEHRKELDKTYGNSVFETGENGQIVNHLNKDYNEALTKILDKLKLPNEVLTARRQGETPEELVKRSLAYGTHDVPLSVLKEHPEYAAHHREKINAFSRGYGVRPETARQILSEAAEGNHSFKKAALIRALLHRQKGEDIGHLGEYIGKESNKTQDAQIAQKLKTLQDATSGGSGESCES